ncbi:MAG: hypothetical protein ACRCTM_07240 [Sphaerotilus sulfidivorans]|jgi:hypothetical protein|uniref:hypothetical protein n=1 Tax=Sphaerotilus sulfidivorans TaxID=639200 RepID=UPI003F40D531
MYTLEDYAAAKAKLESLNKMRENYDGNNPNKYQAKIETAKADLHLIEESLKQSGLLSRTETEERDLQLDAAFPNAQSRQVVEWKSRKYMRRFSPVSKSLSGKTVKDWRGYWEEVK